MWQNFLMKRIIDKSFVRLDESRCLKNRSKYSHCSNCVDICPQHALKVSDEKLIFESDKCSDCKLCIHQCPTEALNYEFEQLHKYEKQIKSCEAVCFTCEEQKESNNVSEVILPCMSSLLPEMLMIADLYEKNTQIFYDEHKCQSCKQNKNFDGNLEWVNDWNNLSCLKTKVEMISKKEQKVSAKRKLSRRELFSYTNEKKNQIALFLFDSFNPSITLKNKLQLPERREYFSAFLKKRKLQGAVPCNLREKLSVANVKVESDCHLCQKCSTICPTGALKLAETKESKSLVFQTERCIDCDLCTNFCSKITKKQINFEDLTTEIILQEQSLNECPKCGEQKLETEHFCEECQLREMRKKLLLHNL
ncbi:4Fe-4S binding protein [Bacillus sp. B15-48]|uniref:4Fe-4S binding protein n=1 Tax=Bacillus sp. B15-48 TaxID=1548601 RepID=UPI00193FD840|nr:4Fe-4S binding protein [Bacillus sp. B15-48]MBM4761065.1 4Fe-4S dicluster domain-containing protein [Bacillus sp. B15-48]